MSKQIGVRLDDDLYAAIEKDAKDNGRTVTQSVRFLLQRALAEDVTIFPYFPWQPLPPSPGTWPTSPYSPFVVSAATDDDKANETLRRKP